MKQVTKGRNPLNSLKINNQRVILDLLRQESPLSIAELAARTALSKVTVTKTIDHYREIGLIVDTGKGSSGEDGGKRPNMFAFNPNYRYIFCVKLDGFNMLAALTNLKGKIIASHTALYTNQIDLDLMIKYIGDAFHLLLERENKTPSQCIAMAAGLHGVIDPDQGVCLLSPQFFSWGRNIPLRDMLRKYIPGEIPIYVDNWVHYYARGEIHAMKKPAGRLFLISSEIEGLNGALMVDGKLYRGGGSLSGEIGHMIVDTSPGAEVCQCGGMGCFEAVVSPKRLTAKVAEMARRQPGSILHGLEKVAGLSFKDILDASNAGDPLACSVMDTLAGHFAVGISNIMQVCDPELFIIQGEYSAAGDYFLARLRDLVPRVSLQELDRAVNIRYSTLGLHGAITGAGNYAADLFFASA